MNYQELYDKIATLAPAQRLMPVLTIDSANGYETGRPVRRVILNEGATALIDDQAHPEQPFLETE